MKYRKLIKEFIAANLVAEAVVSPTNSQEAVPKVNSQAPQNTGVPSQAGYNPPAMRTAAGGAPAASSGQGGSSDSELGAGAPQDPGAADAAPAQETESTEYGMAVESAHAGLHLSQVHLGQLAQMEGHPEGCGDKLKAAHQSITECKALVGQLREAQSKKMPQY